jgi:alpha-tubulin suppressor-like RCC1 family protein
VFQELDHGGGVGARVWVGYGGEASTKFNKPQAIISGVNQISTGYGHTCVLLTDSTLRCWGFNSTGQLGDGTSNNRTVPTKVGSNLNTWASVAVGYSHTCALKQTGTLWCWGGNTNGQIGDGTKQDRNTPTQVGKSNAWQSVSAGGFMINGTTCGVKKNGTLWCWGDNQAGQYGDGTKTSKTTPTQVGSLSTWKSMAVGGARTCGLKTDGTLWCAGSSFLGDGSTSASSVFVKVLSTKKWDAFSSDYLSTCGIKTDGTLWCWGYNFEGQVGDGTTKDRYSPVQVGSSINWLSVSVGPTARWTFGGVTCGSKTDGTAWCWGRNQYGQVGNGKTTMHHLTPFKVAK